VERVIAGADADEPDAVRLHRADGMEAQPASHTMTAVR
jgi:hypothetical protein